MKSASSTVESITNLKGEILYDIHNSPGPPDGPCGSHRGGGDLLSGSGSGHGGIFKARIAAFPECFFVAESKGKIIGFINGCATDSKTIHDEMYEDSACHKPDGAYQSIFGLDVIPDYRCQGIAAALMNHMIENAGSKGRKGLILTCKDRLIHYYAKFGYKNMGVSESVHGGAVWYDMILEFEDQKS